MKMECTTATELLPWLLNGSLDDQERRGLMEHLAGCAACRAELAETAAAWDLISAHPPASLLAAWAEGDDIADAGALAGHVAACPTCEEEAALVREAATLEALVPVRDRPVGGGATQWRRIAIAAILVAGVGLTALLGSWLRIGARDRLAVNQDERGRIAAAEARIETLSAELEALTERTRALAEPLANLPVIELLPTSFTLRGGSEPASVAFGTEAVTLILAPGAETGSDGYRLRVIDDDGTEIWRADDLVLQPTDDFTVLLPLGAIRAGELRLVVDGRRGADWSELETYRLVISG